MSVFAIIYVPTFLTFPSKILKFHPPTTSFIEKESHHHKRLINILQAAGEEAEMTVAVTSRDGLSHDPRVKTSGAAVRQKLRQFRRLNGDDIGEQCSSVDESVGAEEKLGTP